MQLECVICNRILSKTDLSCIYCNRFFCDVCFVYKACQEDEEDNEYIGCPICHMCFDVNDKKLCYECTEQKISSKEICYCIDCEKFVHTEHKCENNHYVDYRSALFTSVDLNIIILNNMRDKYKESDVDG